MPRGKPAKPEIVRLSEMAPGQHGDFFARLSERTKGTTRDGKPFYACRFRDARRTATCMVWADSEWYPKCDQEWKQGDIFKIRGTYQEHDRYGPQVEIHQIRHATDADREAGFDEADFVDRSRFGAEEMLAELRDLVAGNVVDEPLRRLVLGLLEKHAEALKRLPASPRHYFPFAGGWLEHTLSVAQSCLWLADRYAGYYAELTPPLNRDLVVAGAVLHEIGRVVELEPVEPYDATVPGRLFGHVLLARDVVRDAAREQGDVDPELLQLLEHVLAAHLTLPEWGSPRLPMIPEVLILHHADDLDAKLEMYARCLSRDTSPGPFTERDPIWGKQLRRQRKW